MKREIKKLIAEFLILSVSVYGLLYLLIKIKIVFLYPVIFLLIYFSLPLLALIYATRISNRTVGSIMKKILIFLFLLIILFIIPFIILSIFNLTPPGF